MDPQRGNATKTGSKAGATTPKVSAQGANGAQRKPSPKETTPTKPSASGPQKRPQVRARGARTEKAPLSAEDTEDWQAALAEGTESPAAWGPPLPRAGSRREGGARTKKVPLNAKDTEDRQAGLAEGPKPSAGRGPPLARAGSRREEGARTKKAPLSAEDTEDRQAGVAEGPEPPTVRGPPLPRAGSRSEGGARTKKVPLNAKDTEDRQAGLAEGPKPSTGRGPPLARAGSRREEGARTKKVPLNAKDTEDGQAGLAEGPEPPTVRGHPLPRAGSRSEGGARTKKKAPLSAKDAEDRQAGLAEGPEPSTGRGPPLPRAGSRREGGARTKKAPLCAEDILDGQAIMPEGPEPPLRRAESCREGAVRSAPERRPLSRPTEVPDEPLVPAPSLCLGEQAPRAWNPRAVLKKLKLRSSEISKAAEAVNSVVDLLLRRLQSCHSAFKGVSLLGTGSYYERVKVSAPNEFDVMFQLDIPRIQLEEYRNSGAHYFVKFKRNPRGNPLNEFLEEELLSASKMLSKFREIIKEEVKNIADVSVKEEDEQEEEKKRRSPAVTLLIRKSQEISVDIILALKVKSSWPDSTQEGLPIRSWLGAKVRRNLRLQPFYLVPKFAKEGNRFQEETWRLSFSHIEKNILENHGKAKTCCEYDGVKCCRKDCLKLMKYLLEQLKEKFGNRKELNEFCSYHVKTAFFHGCAENPDDSDWQSKDVEPCFDRCVQYFLQCLEKECLENFFIPVVNLFSRDTVDKNSKKFLLQEIEYERNNGYPIFGEF